MCKTRALHKLNGIVKYLSQKDMNILVSIKYIYIYIYNYARTNLAIVYSQLVS